MRFAKRLGLIVLLSTSAANAQWLPAGATSGPIYYNGGNVGIGTTDPGSTRLWLDGTGTQLVGTTYYTAIFRDGNIRGVFLGYDSSGPIGVVGPIGVSCSLAFYSHNGTSWGERMRVAASGNIGIGTTTPAAALDVNGSINVSGNINAKYQDVAEWVPSNTQLAAGTVVVLSPEYVNTVMPSERAYDETVAGVVSATPGLILGEASPNKVKVATTGRVRVRADATNHAIAIGDLLVTSSARGTAMRSQAIEINGRRFHQPGTIIGKALEPLNRGEGEILVLLSLQ